VDSCVTSDHRWVLIFHGNTDAGGEPHMLLQCTAISIDALRPYPPPLRLRDSLAKVFRDCEPNRYGYT
jgi:hypothetical protein